MKQTITIRCRASAKGLEKKIREYEKQGWRVISKERGSWWGKVGNSYNWSVIFEREESYQLENQHSKKEESIIEQRPTNLKREDCHPSNNQIPEDEESIIDQIIKLKELLDSNALTQEEYDLLKKRILK